MVDAVAYRERGTLGIHNARAMLATGVSDDVNYFRADTYMTLPTHGQAIGGPQPRPSVANVLVSLRVRLPLLVALILTVVVGAAGYWELRVFETSITADLQEIARSTGQAVADDIEVGEEPSKREDLADSLREFTYAFPSIRAILVVTVENDEPTVVASTSSAEGRDWLLCGKQRRY
jgi:hypothetical protein